MAQKEKTCPRCGAKLELLPGGVVYECPGCSCSFHKGELLHHAEAENGEPSNMNAEEEKSPEEAKGEEASAQSTAPEKKRTRKKAAPVATTEEPPAASATGNQSSGESSSEKQPGTPAGESEVMTTKTKKSTKKSAKKEAATSIEDRKIKLLPKVEASFNEGSLRGKCYSVIKEHGNGGMKVAEYVSVCAKKHISKGQAIGCLNKLAAKGKGYPKVELV